MSRVVAVVPIIHVPTGLAHLVAWSPAVIDPVTLPRPPYHQREPVIDIVNGTQWEGDKPKLRLVTIWNTPEANLGVSESWNAGIDELERTDADWLWVLSAAVRFGPKGGADFLSRLDEFAAVRPDVPVVEASGGQGWHAIAFSRRVLEKVGRFDPIFWPGYFEDNDWSVRYQRAYQRNTHAPDFVGPLWPKVDMDATLTEIAHGIKRGGVHVDMGALEDAFRDKWGLWEEYETPYNDPELDWTHTGGRP